MSRKCEKFSRVQEPHMTAVVEARTMLCAVPLDLSRGESKGVWLQRVSRLHGIAPALGKRLYYGELKGMDADVFAQMKRRHAEILSLNQRIDALKNAENRHGEEANAIRRYLEVGRQGVPVAGGQVQRGGDRAPQGGGVVPRPTD